MGIITGKDYSKMTISNVRDEFENTDIDGVDIDDLFNDLKEKRNTAKEKASLAMKINDFEKSKFAKKYKEKLEYELYEKTRIKNNREIVNKAKLALKKRNGNESMSIGKNSCSNGNESVSIGSMANSNARCYNPFEMSPYPLPLLSTDKPEAKEERKPKYDYLGLDDSTQDLKLSSALDIMNSEKCFKFEEIKGKGKDRKIIVTCDPDPLNPNSKLFDVIRNCNITILEETILPKWNWFNTYFEYEEVEGGYGNFIWNLLPKTDFVVKFEINIKSLIDELNKENESKLG